ncbi:MAG: hypothetical protein CSA75_04510 [Sorangium cellulosum]|nr:MAG: hypothetical protein CSA75_04510 [Sorangium cellulosum]
MGGGADDARESRATVPGVEQHEAFEKQPRPIAKRHKRALGSEPQAVRGDGPAAVDDSYRSPHGSGFARRRPGPDGWRMDKGRATPRDCRDCRDCHPRQAHQGTPGYREVGCGMLSFCDKLRANSVGDSSGARSRAQEKDIVVVVGGRIDSRAGKARGPACREAR